MIEIERKFLLKHLPIQVLSKPTYIIQSYLPLEFGSVRLRRIEGLYKLTVKSKGNISRKEFETDIPKWVYDLLFQNITKDPIHKLRYEVKETRMVVDWYSLPSGLSGLQVLECEFDSEDEATDFKLPEWAGEAKEITEDPNYKNSQLFIKGIRARFGSHNFRYIL